jgi:hypothetical protein
MQREAVGVVLIYVQRAAAMVASISSGDRAMEDMPQSYLLT